MAKCDADIHTHKTAASQQSDRMPAALRTDFIHLDERGIADLIESTNKLSEQINFFDSNNVLANRWGSFFKWETTSILAQVSKLDIDSLLAEFKLKKRELLFTSSVADQQQVILPFFEEVSERIHALLQNIENLPDDFKSKAYFKQTQNNLKEINDEILKELTKSSNLQFTLQHHLFNKKVQNLLGLLKRWKVKSLDILNENLESYPKHTPQYALYLAFLKLFGFAQDNLNEFTQRHLDFYYNKILKLYPEQAVSDAVHICIEPHKNASSFLIPKHSIFLAGKDSNGHKKYYKSTADAVINQARVSAIFGSAIKGGKYYFQDLTAMNASGNSWKTFPQNELCRDIGFAMASPLLYLRGGERNLKLSFIDALGEKIPVKPDAFNFFLSGEEGWYQANAFYENGETTLNIPAEDDSIVPFDKEIHEGISLDTAFPVLKIITKEGKIDNASFNSIQLDVSVTNYKQFKLFNATGEIDHTKNFEPYGSMPKKGNAMVFACKEFFLKKNAKGNLNITTDHTTEGFDMLSLSKFNFLQNGKWQQNDQWDSSKTDYPFTNQSPISFDFTEDRNITAEDANGFARFTLNDDNYLENTYLESYITGAKTEGSTPLPYLPNILNISLDYTVSSNFSVSSSENTRAYSLFHLYPKGYKPLKNIPLKILPPLTNKGECFIGIKGIKAGNSANLLFQIAPGTANPRQKPIKLKWYYLDGLKWKEFQTEDIGDETHGLTESGIIKLNSPEDLNFSKQTEWPAGYWWVKIEAKERIDAVCEIIGIHDQALKAKFTDYESIGTHFTEHSEADSISKLLKPNKNIKKIKQPYISFGGKLEEDSNLFYQRTSERLRHKGRGISIWDYEKLVLDNFPDVHQVKCLNHYRYDSAELNNSSAGYVTLIPVAKASSSKIPNYWKPLVDLGTMKRIEDFIKDRISPHVRLAVKPPKLEKLELAFKVKYIELPGADTRFYAQQLQEVINAFLSPWAFKENSPVVFQKSLNKSTIVHLIEQQTYVDYISDFKVNHLILDDTTNAIAERQNDIDKIAPKTVYSLFIPHTHKIESLTVECCS